jgi:cellulose synthase/poly-beta-1,6-N-acetylglucosamine synthase-like glycosyltransferase
MSKMLEWILWLCVGMIMLVAIVYPMLLALLRPFARRTLLLEASEPDVTLVIAAHNEEGTIAAKLKNCLELRYPRDRLEIVVASDGSTDRTDEIVRSFAEHGIMLAKFPRIGKTGIQNRVAARARGEILVFSDANASYGPDAIAKLVRHFADSAVGGVCGQLVYRVAREGAGSSERMYWDYEKFMKVRESALSSVVGANGSIYAVRRCDYVEIDEGLISDLVQPLALVRRGKRVVYEPEAVSVEDASTNYNVEFRRKVRILTRGILGLLSMAELLNPFRYGIFSVQLIMHKLLRFASPAFLLPAAVALVGLVTLGRYWALALVVLVGVATALAFGRRDGRQNTFLKMCHVLYYYLMVNYALLLAWGNVLRGRHMKVWVPERNPSEVP